MNLPARSAYDHALNVYSQGQLFAVALPHNSVTYQNSSPYSALLLCDFMVGCLLIAAAAKYTLSLACR